MNAVVIQRVENVSQLVELTIKTKPYYPYVNLNGFLVRAEIAKQGYREEIVGEFTEHDSEVSLHSCFSSIYQKRVI